MTRQDMILLGLGFAAGAATLLGGFLALRLKNSLHLILGLSAGAVMGVAFFDLMPESVALAGRNAADVIAVTAAGFAIYMVVDRLALVMTQGGHGHRGHIGAASLTVHSLLDGLGVGLAFQVSPAVGVVLAVAVLAHDISDGINTVTMSLASEGGATTARRWLAADATAPLAGIVLSLFVHVPKASLGLVLALFAGFFLYIGASELIPESHHRHPRLWTTVATVLGLAAMFGVVRLAGL